MNAAQYNLVAERKGLALVKVTTTAIEEQASRKVPTTNSKMVSEYFAELTHPHVTGRTMYSIPQGRFVANNLGAVITCDDKVFLPLSPLRNENDPRFHNALCEWKFAKVSDFDKVTLVATRESSNNYYHWMIDHLTRFYGLKTQENETINSTLIWSFEDKKYQRESVVALKNCGLTFETLLSTKEATHFRSKELIVPPYTNEALSADGISCRSEELAFLKQLFLSPQDTQYRTKSKKIFVSRQGSDRSSEHELTLLEKLKEVGFISFRPELHTVAEQAQCFAEAEIVVGFHGAGLTNIVFCNENTKLIEIFGPDFIQSYYWSLANTLNLEYFAYCEDDKFKNVQGFRFRKALPLEIDPEKAFEYIISCL